MPWQCLYYRECEFLLAGVGLFQQSRQLQYGDLSLLVADRQVLPLAVRRRQHTHGDTTQRVGGDQLADLLPLVTAVAHPYVLKRPLLGSQSHSLQEEIG